jgi:hypothetical protein
VDFWGGEKKIEVLFGLKKSMLFCKLWFKLGFVWLANVYDYE